MYGITKVERVEQTRALFEEAMTSAPYETEELIALCFEGATVFSWTCITSRNLRALRRGLFRIMLTTRGA